MWHFSHLEPKKTVLAPPCSETNTNLSRAAVGAAAEQKQAQEILQCSQVRIVVVVGSDLNQQACRFQTEIEEPTALGVLKDKLFEDKHEMDSPSRR